MPQDLGVLTRLDKPTLDPATNKSTGNTNYTWEAYQGDIQLDGTRQFVPVSGTTKLGQGMFKIILTPLGSNPVDPDYGTNLLSMIGTVVDSEKFSVITSEIIDALTHYNLINQDNPDSDEVIQTIDFIRVVKDIDDPRAIRIQVSVTTESGKPVSLQVPQIL